MPKLAARLLTTSGARGAGMLAALGLTGTFNAPPADVIDGIAKLLLAAISLWELLRKPAAVQE